MIKTNNIEVEIVYATPSNHYSYKLLINPAYTYQQAIEQVAIFKKHPELKASDLKIGVFSKPRFLTDIVKSGDRIEIYRPLLIDPKAARRARIAR